MTNEKTSPRTGRHAAAHPSRQLPFWDGTGWIEAPQDVKLEILRISSEHFRHDISAQWTQAGLFAIIQAALLSLFASAIGPQNADQQPGLLDAREQAIGIAIVGLAFSLLWLLTAIGREKYIRRWRAIVQRVDDSIDPYKIYADIEREATRDLLNPSVIFTYVPALVAVVWIALGVTVGLKG